MDIRSFLEDLKALTKPVVTSNDLSRILGRDKGYVKLYTHRAVKAGYINRIARGRYALKDTDPLAVASGVISPGYISFLTALHYYGLSTQITNTLTVAARRFVKDIKFDGYTIHAATMSNKRFFGFSRVLIGNKYAFIASKEKAIVDCILLPRYCPLAEVYDALDDTSINMDLLIGYALKIESGALLKRLGFLLEKKRGADIYDRVGGKINDKYELLNPYLGRKGDKDKKWKIMENEVL